MNIFTFLLCILMNEVKSQTKDIFPAKLLAPQKTLSENSDLFVVCSTFGQKKDTMGWVYVCINGVGVIKQVQKLDENYTILKIEKVIPENSGEYSCVYSQTEYEPSEVNTTGKNKIRINVIANFHPADLSLSGPSSVNQGAQVEFVCSLPDVLQNLDCDVVQSYLMRDRAVYQVQGFDVKQMQAKFVIQDAVQKDAGRFSCVVRPSQCFKEDEEELSGNNALVLQVKEAYPFGVTVFRIIAVILLLGVFLYAKWRIDINNNNNNQQHQQHQQQHQQHQQQQQKLTEREEREEQASDAGDDFSVDDENAGYQNAPSGHDLYSYVLELEPTYDEVLPSEGSSNGNPSEPQYAVSAKKKQEP